MSDENREDKVAAKREEEQIMKHVNQQTNGHATCHMSGHLHSNHNHWLIPGLTEHLEVVVVQLDTEQIFEVHSACP